MKFGRPVQNAMPMILVGQKSKPKPEVEFQYGGRFFLQTGSNNISNVDYDISLGFGVQVEFDFLKRLSSLHPKPEVDFRLNGRQL